jgi:3-dehydroquinate dehydratase/shikimate dehydrogenase
LSPRLHNGIYRALGLQHLYVSFDVPVFGDFWLDVVEGGSLQELGFPLAGLSVTSPFKEIALAVAGASSPLAERIGAANTLIRRTNVWEAESTDPDGVRGPLAAAQVDVAGRQAAILGAGGAGRAAVFGLGVEGATMTLVNRSPERGRRVAKELGVSFLPFDEFDPRDFDIIVNATPLGAAAGEELAFDPAVLGEESVVIDLAYLPDRPTRLIEETRRLGRTAIDGREALLHQAMAQFRAMNEVAMPVDLSRRILELDRPGGVD